MIRLIKLLFRGEPMAKHILDKANNKYKKLYGTGKARFKNLPFHHRSHSNWLEKENNGQLNSYYSKYKRGTIVFVEFGINVGHELSGGHFAIVLNHNDNKRNSIVNVIPLSSKNKPFYLPIDKTVFENANSELKRKFEEFSKINTQLQDEHQSIMNEAYRINDEFQEGIKLFDSIEEALKLEHVAKLQQKVDELESKIPELDRIIKDKVREKDEIEKVYLKYSKFDKNTYACYQSVQTISKLKIRRINKYDPSGAMKVDNATLDLIDAKIVDYYTNFSIDEI